jgi:hypothetical protein
MYLGTSADSSARLFVMRVSRLHIVLCLLLSVLYIAERGIPCAEDCSIACADESKEEMVQHCDDADHQSPGETESHHCDHCACVCHIPALEPQHEELLPLHAIPLLFSPLSCNPPTAVTSPPDHIPLV